MPTDSVPEISGTHKLSPASRTRPGRLSARDIGLACAQSRSLRIKFAPASIAALRPPLDRNEMFVWSDDLPSFGVRIMRSGFKS